VKSDAATRLPRPHDALHARARGAGVNPIVYWLARAVLQPLFHLYFRLSRIGREHMPETGGVIVCANHRSFLDPFVIGLIARRPLYYVAKEELFRHRLVAWFLSSLGAFPVQRGTGDRDMLETAKAILERGDAVLIFAEGTRIRPGALGRPRRGVGRLALETGAPVVPVAVIGTEAVRKGWVIRPHKVRIRIGSPLTFPRVENPSPQLAAAVTDRIWPMVMLQWEWLGGLPPLRRAAVIGAGSWGTAVAVMLARAGLEVDLGCPTREQADALAAAGENARDLPGVRLPAGVDVVDEAELELSRHDLVCFAVPASSLPAATGRHGESIPHRAGVLVASTGRVAPDGPTPAAYLAARTHSWAVAALGGPAGAADVLHGDAPITVASVDTAFRRQVTEALLAARFRAVPSPDIAAVELADAVPPLVGPATASTRGERIRAA
jgi:1-acyl-sn-glycerol-3-phosphate acyltransferase